ncbi:MAG: DNA-processing protein DprA, partial [Desulfobacterales bacterium]
MEKVLPWLKLKNVPGVGNLLYKRLLDQFGSPEDVFNASESELCRVPGITGRIAGAILSPVPVDADRCEIDLATAKGFGVITLADPAYPALLREIPDPPPFLYVCGNLENIQPCVAVVGSRHATDYGLAAARRLGSDLAACGITIVSGMARGIDTAAHLGALDADGSTIAVLGSGLNRIYPSENMELFQKISIKGAVISEFALNAGPDPHHFPIRNRVISGMSLGTVIVEGSMNSGSLITARLAVEQGREVFA